MISPLVYNTIGITSGIINLLSLLLNIVAVINLYKIDKKVKLSVNMTLICLSIDNILQCIACQIFVTTSCFMRRWGWSVQLCDFYAILTYWLALTAIYLKMVLAWQHHSIVTSKTKIRANTSFVRRAMPTSICAIVALVWCSLPLLGWSSYGLEGILVTCSLTWHNNDFSHLSYNISTMVVAFLLPLSFIATMYIRVVIFLKRQSFTPDSDDKHVNDRTVLTLIKVGSAIAFMFLIMWSPYAIASILMMIEPQQLSPLSQTIPSIVAKASTLALPFMYLLIHKEFRRKTFKMLRLL